MIIAKKCFLAAAALAYALSLRVCAAEGSGNSGFDPMAMPSEFSAAEIKSARRDPAKYTIDSDSIRLVRLTDTKAPAVSPAPGKIGDELEQIGQIINIGKQLWQIVEKSSPVVYVDLPYAAALPKEAVDGSQLEGWSKPDADVYGFYAKNLYGMTVVSVKFAVSRQHSGSYKGKGKYLNMVSARLLDLSVLWGYKLNLTAVVPPGSIVNSGSIENPVAAMQMVLGWNISTPIKYSYGEYIYYIQGNGYFKEIGNPFKGEYKYSGMPEFDENESARQLLNSTWRK